MMRAACGHTTCLDHCEVHEYEPTQAANLFSAAFNLNGEAEKLKAEEREALLESLAIHAPPCPDWFQPVPPPDMPKDRLGHQRGLWRRGQWAWAYAEAVLAARPGGAK